MSYIIFVVSEFIRTNFRRGTEQRKAISRVLDNLKSQIQTEIGNEHDVDSLSQLEDKLLEELEKQNNRLSSSVH